MSRRTLPILTAAFAFLPCIAAAHTGDGAVDGFVAGIAHTIGGIDHVLAMTAVGLMAGHIGGDARWLVPFSFLTAMAAGGMVGAVGLGLPFVQPGIALSILVLGLALSLRVRVSLLPAMAVSGLFALFHGHAHGAGMPLAGSGLAYGAGFVAATAALLGAGVALGRPSMPWLARIAGGVMALAGAGLLIRLL